MEKSREEEVVNSATHFIAAIGTILSTFLILFFGHIADSLRLSIIIMGGLATWTFFSSYLYHSSQTSRMRERNRIVDKCAIYMMISGSGCALSLIVPGVFFSVSSCVCLLLISSYFIMLLCTRPRMSETFSVASYVLLGWFAFIPATGLFYDSPLTTGISFTLAIVGTIFYSIGVVFYVGDSRKWYHTVWHVLVMFGFSFHFAALILTKVS